MVCGVACEATDDDTGVDAHLVETDGAGAGGAGVVVGDEGEGGGDVEGFADAHEGACGEEFLIGLDVTGPPCDGGPCEETGADGEAAAEAVGDPAADWAEEGVDPFELAEHAAPVGVRADVGEVVHDGRLHGGEHLAVEVIEEGDGGEEHDGEPCEGGEGLRAWRGHGGGAGEKRSTLGERTPGRDSPLGIAKPEAKGVQGAVTRGEGMVPETDHVLVAMWYWRRRPGKPGCLSGGEKPAREPSSPPRMWMMPCWSGAGEGAAAEGKGRSASCCQPEAGE